MQVQIFTYFYKEVLMGCLVPFFDCAIVSHWIAGLVFDNLQYFPMVFLHWILAKRILKHFYYSLLASTVKQVLVVGMSKTAHSSSVAAYLLVVFLVFNSDGPILTARENFGVIERTHCDWGDRSSVVGFIKLDNSHVIVFGSAKRRRNALNFRGEPLLSLEILMYWVYWHMLPFLS